MQATGAGRQAIDGDFSDKLGRFLTCFDAYQERVVTPASFVVEMADADLDSMHRYVHRQLQRARQECLPGPGCFVANSATEVAPPEPAAMDKVRQHDDRLYSGFLHAINTSSGRRSALTMQQRRAAARACVAFTNGLWCLSRQLSTQTILHQAVRSHLTGLKASLQ